MPDDDLLDKLVGTGVPYETIVRSLDPVEICLLGRVARTFGFDSSDPEYVETVCALYRFKQVLRHYGELYKNTPRCRFPPKTEDELDRIFRPILITLSLGTRGCFAEEKFFGPVRFMLHQCKTMNLSRKRRLTYLKWLYSFPIVPAQFLKEIVEHDFRGAVYPHVYMEMVAGLVRAELIRGRSPKEITVIYRKFLRQRSVSQDHARWFSARLPGSFGSKQ